MTPPLHIKDPDKAHYLQQCGWSAERRVDLPVYIDAKTTPHPVLAPISNLYGLTLEDRQGHKRDFTVHEAYIRDFETDMREWVEDTGLAFEFYPLGAMSEYGGILLLDQHARFYLAANDLIYYGDTLEAFFDVVIFGERGGIAIMEAGRTVFCHDNQDTGYPFSIERGWAGDPSLLSRRHITARKI